MAAGNSRRFGENKLTTVFNGRSLIRYAFDAVSTDKLHRICVVTQYDSIASLAEQYGFLCIRNHHPEEGISLSVKLGTTALMDEADAIIYMVADQPNIRRESIAGLIDLSLENPGRIISAAHNGKRGNPCLFPKKYFPELLLLTGDTGGSSVIRSHPEDLLLYELDREELRDIDTKEDLDHCPHPSVAVVVKKADK